MKAIFTILLGLSFTIGSAQLITFVRSYGGTGFDYGRDVIQDLDTGYICTGSSTSFLPDNGEAFLMKTDSLGQFQWSFNYGAEGSEWGEGVILTLDSMYALGGYSNSSWGAGGFDFFLVKAGQNGAPIFQKTYGGPDWDRAFDIGQLPDSGFVLVGETYSYGAGQRDCYIVRTDKNGDTIWTKTWGGSDDDYLKAVWIDGDSIVAVGGTQSFGAGMDDGLILKMGSDGNIGWTHITGDTLVDYFNCIEGYGSYYVIGGQTEKDYALTLQDPWYFKIENDGSIVHNNFNPTNATAGDEECMAITVRQLNGDIVTANLNNSFGIGNGNGDLLLGKWTSNFGYVTGSWYGHEGTDIPYGVDDTYDGGIIVIADYSEYGTGGHSFMLLKKNITWNNLQISINVVNDSITTSIPMNSKSAFDAYPTIVEEFINITGIELIESINIFNINGQLVYSDNVKSEVFGNYIFDAQQLESGLYILQVISEGQSHTKKFVKQ